MSAPAYDAVYVHTLSGARFRYVGNRGDIINLVRIDDAEDNRLYGIGWVKFDVEFVKADDLLALAEAVGVVADAAGKQPLSEFMGGPTFTPSKWWTDKNLAEVFELDQAAGGGQ